VSHYFGIISNDEKHRMTGLRVDNVRMVDAILTGRKPF